MEKKKITVEEMQQIINELKKIECSFLVMQTGGEGTHSQVYDTFPNSASFFHASAVQFSEVIKFEMKKAEGNPLKAVAVMNVYEELMEDILDMLGKALRLE